jgi:hypothetical protein
MEGPAKSETTVKLATMKARGLPISRELCARADQIIE